MIAASKEILKFACNARSVLFMCAIITTNFLWQRPHDIVATSLWRERSELTAVREGEVRLGGGVCEIWCMLFVMCVLCDLSCVTHRHKRTHVWNSLHDTQAHGRVTPS